MSPLEDRAVDPAAPVSSRRRIAVLLACLVVVVAAAVGWRMVIPRHVAAAVPRGAGAPVPVTGAPVTRANVPIALTALGTVQAWTTVSVRARVDGTVESVPFTEGQLVHAGDVLARIDPRTYQAALDGAKAKQQQDEAQLDNARKNLARGQELARQGFASQQVLDQQQVTEATAAAAVAADKAAVESAQVQLDYTTIRAPIDARAGIRQVDPGNIVKTSDATPIVVLTQTTPAAIIFTLPQKQLPAVRRAMQRGRVAVEAYDAVSGARLASGEVMLVDNVIDQTTGTIRLKARFANADEALWPGQFVNVRVLLGAVEDALTVPSAAVQRGQDGLFAWRIEPDGTARPQPIEVGPAADGLTVVAQGLSAGDQVVVDGQFRLRPGSRVEATAAASATAGGGAQ